jgi:membrane dipeptidase
MPFDFGLSAAQEARAERLHHSKRPVTANHTAARGVFAHPRGKSDEALRAIADTGGVIGVVAVPYFLSKEPAATVEDMLDHMDHIAGVVGWKHVAIGTDWPLQVPDDVLKATLGTPECRRQAGWNEQHRRDVTQRLVGFEDCRDLPNITRGLVKRGYDDGQIRAILGESALRVFETVCG